MLVDHFGAFIMIVELNSFVMSVLCVIIVWCVCLMNSWSNELKMRMSNCELVYVRVRLLLTSYTTTMAVYEVRYKMGDDDRCPSSHPLL